MGLRRAEAASSAQAGIRALQSLAVMALCLLATACQTAPAVHEVWSSMHLEPISAADQDLFLSDPASQLHTLTRLLPQAEQGEKFYVNWSGRGVDMVQFEYRQLNVPDKITAQAFRPNRQTAHDFWIRGDDFLKGGSISAWRVTLWQNGKLLAEKHSMLW